MPVHCAPLRVATRPRGSDRSVARTFVVNHKAPLRAVPWPRGSGCLPLLHTGPLQRAVSWPLKGASGFLAHRRSSKAAGLSAAMGGGGSKGRGKSKSPGPKGRKGPPTIDDVQRTLVRCMRHGEAGCRGRFAPGGLYPVDELIEQLGITINQYNQAVAHDANQRKPRLDTWLLACLSRPLGRLRPSYGVHDGGPK